MGAPEPVQLSPPDEVERMRGYLASPAGVRGASQRLP